MNQDQRLSGRVGSRWRIAIEWDVPAGYYAHRWLLLSDVPEARRSELLDEPWRRHLGSFWVWADGHLLGNPYDMELLGVGLGLMIWVAEGTGRRASPLLSLRSRAEALDLVMESIYGENADLVRAEYGNLGAFEVMPAGNPYFDGWQAIVLEEGQEETLIWRQGADGSVITATWPLGEIRRVVSEVVAVANTQTSLKDQ